MSQVFDITAASDHVPLRNGEGRATFTVTNTSGRALRGRARIVPVEPAQADWFSIEGDVEREFGVDATHQFAVKIDAANVPVGRHAFRLDAFAVANPDEDYTRGPAVGFEVAEAAEPVTAGFSWWIVAAVAVTLVLVIGISVWLTRGDPVPDVVDQPLTAGISALEDAGFANVEVKRRITGTAKPQTVIDQVPRDARLRRSRTVELVIEADPPVPLQPEENVVLSASVVTSDPVAGGVVVPRGAAETFVAPDVAVERREAPATTELRTLQSFSVARFRVIGLSSVDATFAWEPVEGAGSYAIEVIDSDGEPVSLIEDIATPAHRVTLRLPTASEQEREEGFTRHLQWRVWAVSDSGDAGARSEWRPFQARYTPR